MPLDPAHQALVTRHHLGLGAATISVLRSAAERELNLPAARAARAASGRAAGAAKLVGRRTRAVKVKTPSVRVVVERGVSLNAPLAVGDIKKRRSGRSGASNCA